MFPTYHISDLTAAKPGKDVLTIDRFKKYLSVNPHLHGAHKHTFYHLVYFTKGKGSQVIDFTRVPVQPGMIYFMNPAQVHQWLFEAETDGYIVNFSATFFEQLLISSQLLHRFDFFNGDPSVQVIRLSKTAQQKVVSIFENMLRELKQGKQGVTMMLASQLLQLFITVQRDTDSKNKKRLPENHHAGLFRQFTELVNQHYTNKRLPKEYASLLFITTSKLNAVSQEIAGISSGEVIRNRVILEAKRLLVNFELPIEEIADKLNFEDSSYFVKFFKKYTEETPDHFRKLHYATR